MKQIKIVVIDDSPTDLFILMKVFGKNPLMKIEHIFTSGVEFLKKHEDLAPFDILLLDMHLPVMNGRGVLEQIKKLDKDFMIYAMTYGLYPNIIPCLKDLGVQAFSRKDPQIVDYLIPRVMNHETIYEDQSTNAWVLNGIKTSIFQFDKAIWNSLLTMPESEIFNGAANNLSIEQIIAKSEYGPNLMRKHYQQIMTSLRFKSHIQLRHFAIINDFGDLDKSEYEPSFWLWFYNWL